eukprot:TRINITY_DN3837_c0_g1_i1.p1 TRINITY_DN3837_c0_g1~~TRINITY_DN3837_c0_g1_i1.p1  ORF type:complete len:305 (-),score=59.19 TRINITY_DN3837_c0_g1_i1:40-954(-)
MVHLKEFLTEKHVDESLVVLFTHIGNAISEIRNVISTASVSGVGTTNRYGDEQLTVDIITHSIMLKHLKESNQVATAASEEASSEKDLGGVGFSVAFDPLDGSSIVDANFSVGTIFGIWPKKGLVGRTGRDQVGAGYAIYGPRTTLVITVDTIGSAQEFTLSADSKDWNLTRSSLTIEEGKIFAPANLRSTTELEGYKKLVQYYIDNRYTLRYTGGMVPDINHILIKGRGVFASPVAPNSPAKLRLLYECAPLAKVFENAGGASTNGEISILDVVIENIFHTSAICLGSKLEVKRFIEYLSTSH